MQRSCQENAEPLLASHRQSTSGWSERIPLASHNPEYTLYTNQSTRFSWGNLAVEWLLWVDFPTL